MHYADDEMPQDIHMFVNEIDKEGIWIAYRSIKMPKGDNTKYILQRVVQMC